MSNAQSQIPQTFPSTETRSLVIVVYLLYLAAVISAGLAGVIGVFIAYVKRGDTQSALWQTHFENQITAFWVWFMLFVVGCATSWMFGLGFLLIIGAFVYFLYRTIRGLIRALDNQPYA